MTTTMIGLDRYIEPMQELLFKLEDQLWAVEVNPASDGWFIWCKGYENKPIKQLQEIGRLATEYADKMLNDTWIDNGAEQYKFGYAIMEKLIEVHPVK